MLGSARLLANGGNLAKNRKFVIHCEFELFGEELNNVVTSCPQLNIHTTGDSIQTAMGKLAEAVKFFFDTAEARHEFPEVLEALERDRLEIPPWGPGA